MKITYIVFIFCAVLGLHVEAQTRQEVKNQIQSQLRSISEKYPSASISFSLSEPESGNSVVDYNSSTALMPASTVKTITTAVALETLGADYRFKTVLAASTSSIKEGLLKGNIIIKGSGDPTLGSDRISGNSGISSVIATWVQAIRDRGIKEISGDIITDNTGFNRNAIPPGWIWTDIGNYYGAGSYGLNINENEYKIFFKPGKQEGDPAEVIRVEPEIPGLTFINEMKTGPKGSGDNGYIFGGTFSNTRYLSGTIPAGVAEFSIKGSMPDPGLFAAQLLKKELEKNGIRVSGDAVVNYSGDLKTVSPDLIITVHESPQLHEIVKHTNHYSINLYAEALLNAMGRELKGKGETGAGIAVIKSYLKNSGIIPDLYFLIDGSGLSPQNSLSSASFTNFLNRMYRSKTYNSFFASLPVAGKTGTVASIGRGTEAEGKIHAKSGSFERVIAYNGYVEGKSGKLYSFCIIANNYSGKSYQIRKEIETLFVLMSRL